MDIKLLLEESQETCQSHKLKVGHSIHRRNEAIDNNETYEKRTDGFSKL